MQKKRFVFTNSHLRKSLILIAIIAVMFAVFSMLAPAFLKLRSMMNLILQTATLMTVSLGVMFVIMMGNTDLSVGSQIAICGVVGALVVSKFPENSAMGAAAAILATLATAVACGAFNGFLIGICRVSPFMTTLATMELYRGISLVLCGDARVGSNNNIYNALGQSKIGIFPIVGFLLIALIIVVYVLLNRTTFGRKTYAVGGNAEAARISGVNPGLQTLLVYTFVGLMVGIGAIITVGRTRSAQPLAGKNLEFEAITAVVLGGNSLAGGTGSVFGTVLGSLLVGTMTLGLSFLDISIATNYLLRGAMILIAVFFDILSTQQNLSAAGRSVRKEARNREKAAGERHALESAARAGHDWKDTLELRNITKVFPGVKALDDVSITIRRGKVLALIGENGAGKSTLMKVLSGIYTKDAGEILADGKPVEIRSPMDSQRLGISVIYQELSMIPEMSVYNNVFLGRERAGRVKFLFDTRYMKRRAVQLLGKFGLKLNVSAPSKKFTVGQRQMMEIIRAVDSDAKVVVMDEPTASITNADKEKLFDTIRELKAQGVAVVFISHRMSELFEIADEVAVMRDGRHVVTAPIEEMDEQKLIRYMVDRELNNIYDRQHREPGKVALEVRGLTRKGVFENISFKLHEGEVLGFSGLIGSGRSEIMRCIFGLDKADSGEIFLYGEPVKIHSPKTAIARKIAFVTEDRRGEGIIPQIGVGVNITFPMLKQLSRHGWIDLKTEREVAQSFVDKLSIKTPGLEQNIGNLSGGNQQKCCIAKWLAIQPQIIILDEPTKGIDVGAKAEVHRIIDSLARENYAVIIISSELPEIIGASDNIIVMYEGRITGEFNTTRDNVTQDVLMTSASGISA